MTSVYIGTSGWTYDAWRHGFYRGVPRARWLQHYAAHFNAVEVNGTFYHLLERQVFEGWRARTPEAFRFAVKGHRMVTHVRRLANARESVDVERERAEGLGDRLAVVLWQMHRGLGKDMERLRDFTAALARWPATRHALEFRHASWFDHEVADWLAAHRLAACISDAADWPMWLVVTTDLAYVRLHGHERTYRSPYGDAALAEWADRVREWAAEGREVHVYFDNTDEGAAPLDAGRLRALLADLP